MLKKKRGQKRQFSTSPFSPLINALEHGAFQAAQNSSVSALSQRASLQPCMYIGDVLSLLTTFLCSADASWPEAGQDSRTAPMVPQVDDLGMKIISGYFSAKSFLQLSKFCRHCELSQIKLQKMGWQINWPHRSSTENPINISIHMHVCPYPSLFLTL